MGGALIHTDARSKAFEALYRTHRGALERYVFYKIAHRADAEDVLMDILAAACAAFPKLADEAAFKPWLFAIAAHKLTDYYKAKARRLDIPAAHIGAVHWDAHGNAAQQAVRDTLAQLGGRDRQILYLFYILGYSQRDIAHRLAIPEGTVKSRVHAAKRRFRGAYPYPPKGVHMNNDIFPAVKPPVSIQKSDRAPFDVTLRHLPGWFITARVGQRVTWAFYEDPDGRLTGINAMASTREAIIHGVPCVEIAVKEQEGDHVGERTLYVRTTDTHIAHIAEARVQDGAFHFASFVDDEWLTRYAVGEGNAGYAIHRTPQDSVRVHEDGSITAAAPNRLDIMGRYAVQIGSRTFDTAALVNADTEGGVLSVHYVDRDGRAILFRRYNADDWERGHCGARWSEKLPGSERLTVNGATYVHWYDCIADYVL